MFLVKHNFMAPQFLKTLRDEASVSQMQVAEWLGIAHPTYNRKENGKIPLTLQELVTVLENFKRFIPQSKLIPIILEIFGLSKDWLPNEGTHKMKDYSEELIEQLKENKRLLEVIADLKEQLYRMRPFEPSRQTQDPTASSSHLSEEKTARKRA
jgi:transcriptional regulator with XRE-family HTH domain